MYEEILPKKLSSFVGFTLIELLVVMTIIGILFGVGVAQYTNFNRRQILEQASRDLINNLRLAQTKAANGEKPLTGCENKLLDGYRVKFASGNPDSYTLVAVCDGAEVSPSQMRYNLPSVVKFNPLPSPSEVLFKVLAQGTDLNSDLTITLTAPTFNQQRQIVVRKNGQIDIPTPTPTSPPTSCSACNLYDSGYDACMVKCGMPPPHCVPFQQRCGTNDNCYSANCELF